jgi:acyl-coenzyme A thioesterase PaaI-like protein
MRGSSLRWWISACGYSALSLAPPDTEVLTVEYKVNFLAPAQGERFVARGRVVRSGRTITVCSGEVVAITGTDEKQVAVILATMIAIPAADQ